MIYTVYITHVEDFYELHTSERKLHKECEWMFNMGSVKMFSLFKQAEIKAAEEWLEYYYEFICQFPFEKTYRHRQELMKLKQPTEIINYFKENAKNIFVVDKYPGKQLLYIEIIAEEFTTYDGQIIQEPIELHEMLEDIKNFKTKNIKE